MARPQKTGLEYFPFDVGLLKDKKLRRPKMKYGYLATAIYLALLTLLYSDKGYYIPYGKPNEKDDCIWFVFDCLQGKYQPKANTIAEVIDDLVACGLFSRDRYPKYITSKRAQSVYYSATVERKSVVIDDAIWLLNLDEMKILSERHVYYLSKQSQPQNGVFRTNNSENRPNNTQSKGKKGTNTDMYARARFCALYNIQGDDDTGKALDFAKLQQAYAESAKFLQSHPIARYMSWIVKNYGKILSGKYKDFPKSSEDAESQDATTESAKRLNDIFADLNKDL